MAAWSWDCLDCVEAVVGSTASGLSFQLLLGRHWLDLGLTSNSWGVGNNIGRHMSETLKWKADHTCLMFINNNKFVARLKLISLQHKIKVNAYVNLVLFWKRFSDCFIFYLKWRIIINLDNPSTLIGIWDLGAYFYFMNNFFFPWCFCFKLAF